MASADKLEKSISTIKYFLFCLDVVTFGLGLTVFGLSLWLWWEDEFSDIIDYLDIYLIYWGLYLIMLKSILVIILSFFACASALLENTLFLFINCIAQLVLFVLGLFGAAVLLTFTSVGSSTQTTINASMNCIAQLVLFVLGLFGAAVLLTFTSVGSSTQSTINASMVNLITYYPQNDWANGRLSFIQENVGCCGGTGPNDYVNKWKPLPTECRDSVTGNAFFYGCAEEVTWYLEGRCYWITGLTLVLCFFHVINSVLSFILLQSIRKEEEESGGRYK